MPMDIETRNKKKMAGLCSVQRARVAFTKKGADEMRDNPWFLLVLRSEAKSAAIERVRFAAPSCPCFRLCSASTSRGAARNG